MTIAGNSSLQYANATYEALFQEVFAQAPNAFVSDLFAQKMTVDGLSFQVPVVASFPVMRQWLGSKAIKDLRAYVLSGTVKPYEATIGLDRLQVEADKTGAVANILRGFLASAREGIEKVLVDQFLANTELGYDGVSLLNSSHPHSNSTGNNLTTSALSPTTYKAARQAMSLFSDEDGRPLNIRPTHLLVGPASYRAALECVGPSRIVSVSNAGALDATSNVVAGAVIPNVYQGEVTVIESSRISGAQWALAHCSPGLMPFLTAVKREPTPYVKDGADMLGDHRFFKDQYAYSIEADFDVKPGLWQCIYGSVTA